MATKEKVTGQECTPPPHHPYDQLWIQYGILAHYAAERGEVFMCFPEWRKEWERTHPEEAK